jgi:hypothetical protein
MTDGQDSDKKSATFTVDHTKSTSVTMPSISRLLNRKSFSNPNPKSQATSLHKETEITVSKSVPPPFTGSRKMERPKLEPQPPEFTKSSATASSSLVPSEFPKTEPTQQTGVQLIEVPRLGILPSEPVATEILTPELLATEVDLSPPAVPAQSLPQLKIQPAPKRAPSPEIPKLMTWDLSLLQSGQDPLGKGLASLFQKGAKCGLFLAIQPPPEGSKVPHFLSTSSIQEKQRIELWTGLRWDPTEVPEVWNQLVKAGNVEFAPPGTFTHLHSNRNVIRSGFGITQNEWLLLIRVGPPNACRGIVAVISHQSLIPQLTEALPFLTAAAPLAA